MNDTGSYNPFADVLATARTYYESNAAAKAATPSFNQGVPLGVNEYGQPYVAGKAGGVLTSSPVLLIGAGLLAIGLIVFLAKN